MVSKKKSKACGYIKPHPSHIWKGEVLKFFCQGVAQRDGFEHEHIWDNSAQGRTMPIMVNADVTPPRPYILYSPRDDSELWQGPVECPCGQSAWLTDGRKVRDLPPKEPRFPQVDVLDRIRALKAKLDKGGSDSLTEEDKAELKEIADAIVSAFQPLMESFQKMAEQLMEYLTAFLDSLDPDTVREMHRMAQVYGEHAETPAGTIELRDAATGEVIAEQVLGYDPIAAVNHNARAIAEDSLQEFIAPDLHDPVEIAKGAIAEPFKKPFHIEITPDDPAMRGRDIVVPIQPTLREIADNNWSGLQRRFDLDRPMTERD